MGGRRIGIRLHHAEGPEIAIVCLPFDPSARLIRRQGLLWSSNPPEWKQEVKHLALAAVDAILGFGERPGAAVGPGTPGAGAFAPRLGF